MNCAHLFNGIGGFALAAHWMGWNNVMHCEIDPFCNKVMNYHFPNSYQHEDIRATGFTIWRGRIDLLTGGFPCQPYSTAGKRKGKEDDRHLWPEMLRAIREIQPGWIVGENVRGLTNWNGGLVFDEVQADLEAEGFEVLPFLLPACAVNAPHRRDRIWFVAYANRLRINGRAENSNKQKKNKQEWHEVVGETSGYGKERIITYTNGQQLERFRDGGCDDSERREAQGRQSYQPASYDWSDWPTQPPVCNRDDGFPGRLVDISFSKWRKESVKALGNAVVPKVAFQLFTAIDQFESL